MDMFTDEIAREMNPGVSFSIDLHSENVPINFSDPAFTLSGTKGCVFVPPVYTLEREEQSFSLIINGEVVQTINTEERFESISIDDFQKKYLSEIDENSLFERFKVELHEEVESGKISKIKFYRIINKMTQKDLANKLGTHQPNVARIERVRYEPNIDTLRQLGRIFNIDYRELMG